MSNWLNLSIFLFFASSAILRWILRQRIKLICVIFRFVSVVKRTRFPDDYYEYKPELYNLADHFRNKLHSIPVYALHAGMTPALQTFSAIYDECQAFRREICSHPLSSACPDIRLAVQALGKSSTRGLFQPS